MKNVECELQFNNAEYLEFIMPPIYGCQEISGLHSDACWALLCYCNMATNRPHEDVFVLTGPLLVNKCMAGHYPTTALRAEPRAL